MAKEMVTRFENLLYSVSEEELEVMETMLDALEKYNVDKSKTLLANTLKMKPEMQDDGSCHCTIPITRLVKNFINTVHGGITATLVDTTMGSLVINNLDPTKGTVTAELKLNYLKPGLGKSLTCVASSIHKGKKIHVCEARVFNDKDELILHATGSFFIIDKKKLGGE
ncbi:hypothetical protein CIB95_02600 [Lottiidibacillus patelloidae]|uniref:Thioesterase domain-containing protein n=1 Tax=Lottiidibacillus patelloidae TaxID=2670334 RepID=A0A263BZ82_9BACI|nr:PaaI family thioesterase [Lottiidibacillus patelloidae]OZM58476.1 hypothetical protein CIB95_02600 [Lottiidibacillus patelloidae]